MPGMNLRAGVTAQGGAQARYGNVPNPTSATEAAFGPGLAPATGGGLAALAPTNAAGVAFWVGVGGFIILGMLYWSLPG